MKTSAYTNGELSIERLVLGEYQTNVYILDDGISTLVVDPTGSASRIMTALGARKPEYILLTHRHSDHVDAACELRDRTGARTVASGLDAEYICGERPLTSDDGFYEPCPVDKIVCEGIDLQVGAMVLKVMSTPGHTPGGICFYLDQKSCRCKIETPVLIGGDMLFFCSMGRTDLAGGSIGAMRRSLKRLAELPDDTLVLTGHDRLTTVGHERDYALRPFSKGRRQR